MKAAGKCVHVCVCELKVQCHSLGTKPEDPVFFLQLFCGKLQDGRSPSIQAVTVLSTAFLKTWRAGLFTVRFDLS